MGIGWTVFQMDINILGCASTLSKIKLVLHTSIVTQVTEFQNFIRGKGSEEFRILQQDYDCSVQQKYKESYVEEKKKDVLIEEKFSEEELFAAVYLVYMLDTNKDIPLRFLFILSCLSRDEVNGILLFLMPIQFTVNKEAVTNLKWVIMQNINDRLIDQSKKEKPSLEVILFLKACSEVLGERMFALNIEKKILDFKTISKVVSSYLSSKEKVNKVKPKVNENYPEIEHDGELYDRARDPPGQRSIYIPPGETSSESYRLSTYIKFPVVSPVNPRQLASSGFYFTGYKDRVKCFSCSLCVENWVQGDDVRLPRWHRDNCDFIHGRDQTNFPILRPGMRNDSTPFNTMPAVSGRPSAGELLTGRRPLGGAPLNANVTETTSTGGGVGGNNGAANFQTARPMIQRRTLNFLPDVTLSSTVSADFE